MTSTATKLDRMVTYDEKSLPIKCENVVTGGRVKIESHIRLKSTEDY